MLLPEEVAPRGSCTGDTTAIKKCEGNEAKEGKKKRKGFIQNFHRNIIEPKTPSKSGPFLAIMTARDNLYIKI